MEANERSWEGDEKKGEEGGTGQTHLLSVELRERDVCPAEGSSDVVDAWKQSRQKESAALQIDASFEKGRGRKGKLTEEEGEERRIGIPCKFFGSGREVLLKGGDLLCEIVRMEGVSRHLYMWESSKRTWEKKDGPRRFWTVGR
jgi:hypothetical protein